MDLEMTRTGSTSLQVTALRQMQSEGTVVDYGAIMICRGGTAVIHIGFSRWTLGPGAVLTLFPNDVVRIEQATADFLVEMLRYDAAILREASLQLEQTVYSLLRKDRCRQNTAVVMDIVNSMFRLLKIYFRQKECACTDALVVLQLKAFFLGFYDWITRNRELMPEEDGTRRTNEIFNLFMETLEKHYRESHDVKFYADRLHITPKYLGTIVRRKTQHTPKVIIDHYVMLQLKLTLRNSDKSVKQIAWEYNFSDVSFFCRYFRLHSGLTPQEFRRTAAGT